jgi:hypothetical protein
MFLVFDNRCVAVSAKMTHATTLFHVLFIVLREDGFEVFSDNKEGHPPYVAKHISCAHKYTSD